MLKGVGTRIGILVLIVLGIALILDIIKRKTKIKRIQDKKETEKRLETSESVFYIVSKQEASKVNLVHLIPHV